MRAIQYRNANSGKSVKLQIPKIQFTDHMKLKKKEGQSVGASVFHRRVTKYLQE